MSDDQSSQTAPPQGHEGGAEPFAAMRQLSAASVDVMSAWTEAWGAILSSRGASVGEAMMPKLAPVTTLGGGWVKMVASCARP